MPGDLYHAPVPAPEQFSADSKVALQAAQDRAYGMRHEYVGTEHILLGLLPTIPEAFRALEVTAEALESAIQATIRPGKQEVPRAVAPYTSRAKQLLTLAEARAAETGFSTIEPEHLLLACVRAPKSISQEVLMQLDVSPSFAAERLTGLLEQRRVPGR